MSYIVLARKYRPGTFDDVVGQDHITSLLKKAIDGNRLAHAYLFCGPRGIGKTSCARILAKALNCEKGPTVSPCNKCPACEEISKGTSFDVLEIDGASNRGIDEIRTLRENVKFAAGYGKFKIYIVDEVHMLTTEAFNALLKTLEEPPEHVKFIFATTDPNKVPTTIISRCQRFDFKRIPFKTIVDYLIKICKSEKFKIEKEALYAIAKAGQGSLRDSLSVLDQVGAITDRSIQGEDVYSMLGLVEIESLFDLTDAIGAKNCTQALKIFNDIIDKGKDIRQFSKDIIEHCRNLMIIKIGGKSLGKLIDYPIEIKELYLKQSKNLTVHEILRSLDLFIAAQDMAKTTETLRTPLEIAFARLTFTNDSKESVSNTNQQKAAMPSRGSQQSPSFHKFSAVGMLKNKKGMVSISDSNENESEQSLLEEIGQGDGALHPITIELIKKNWDALTFAVSRQKMSVATFLQEGFPLEYKDDQITIGFSPEHEFHKKTLEKSDNTRLVEEAISLRIGRALRIKYQIVDSENIRNTENEEEIVQKTIQAFQGKIVNKWHKE